MLELDLLLQPFVDREYLMLDAEQRQIFAELLDYADPQLLDVLLGRELPMDARHTHVIDYIRHAARD